MNAIRWTLVVTLLALTTSGCGMNRRYANKQIRQLPFSSAVISYTSVDPGIVAASGEQSNGATERIGPTTQKLLLTYPHPSPRLGRKYAEVTLRVEPAESEESAQRTVKDLLPASLRRGDAEKDEAASTRTPTEFRAAITYDEFTFLTQDLVADGFFERGERSGAVDVSVTLGSRTTSKTWDRVSSLEKLIARVQSDHRRSAAPKSTTPAALPASAELGAPAPQDATNETTAQPANALPDPAQF